MAVKVQGEESKDAVEEILGDEYCLLNRLQPVYCPNIAEVYTMSVRRRKTAPLTLGYIYTEWVHASLPIFGTCILLIVLYRRRTAICSTS
jgi:hypothetical protein